MSRFNTFTVYLGSSGRTRPVYKEAALEFGRLIGANKKKLVYGGMDTGLMGLLATNALQAGAHVTGIIPRKLKDIERTMENLSETSIVEDLWDRKKRMFMRADVIVGLPGGYGTADEVLEVLYWAHLRLHTKPVVLVNVEGYWNSFIAFLKPLPDFDARFLIVVNKPEDVFPALEKWQGLDFTPSGESFPHFETEICRTTEEPIIIDKASVENAYYGICALGLKQLAKHQRPVGFLNSDGQFDHLLEWFDTAEREKFITEKCLQLFATDADKKKLFDLLKAPQTISINLHTEKWGDRREKPR